MKLFARAVVLAVSLLVSAGPVLAAEVAAPAVNAKGITKNTSENVKADAKAAIAVSKDSVKGKAVDTKNAVKAKLIDINSALEAELKAVPGIGDVYAAKIIAGRPYANKTQLKSRKVLPAILYEQVKEQLIAKQPQK